ncbi:MAG: hypothetical protein K6T73_10190 [Candidatus Bathyarchaeota archaeon]|nr:hypothetical protein [Candidatus Bathyarchaeota archaeon]
MYYYLDRILGEINGDNIVNTLDLVLLAKAYGSKPGDSNWNPNADMAYPWWVIGIADLVTLSKAWGNTLI